MIRDRVQLSLGRGNDLSINILDLIASTILLETASDSDAVAVCVGLVRLVTSVLESDRYLRRPGQLHNLFLQAETMRIMLTFLQIL